MAFKLVYLLQSSFHLQCFVPTRKYFVHTFELINSYKLVNNNINSITRFNIVSSLLGHPVPCYLNSDKLFLILSIQYCNPERDSNLGPKTLHGI